jgi:nucleoside-diphosphate-sugar epimerase
MYLNKSLCIIGGSGFVGSSLINNLDKKTCYNLDKNPSPFFNELTTLGNIVNKHEIKLTKEIKAVVLLAAEHRDDVLPTSLYYDVNVEGTKNVLAKMDEFGIKHIVFTSSVAVYGLNKNNPNENHKVEPFNHYGKSKWKAEQEIKKWHKKDPVNKSVTIIRPTVIFGERNRGNVYNLLKMISTGTFLMIGKGQNKKSMAYVKNVTAFICYRLEREEKGFHVFNYVDKPDFTMKELVSVIEKKMKINVPKTKIPYSIGVLAGFVFDLLAKILGKKLFLSSVRVKKFCATTEFDATKLQNEFNANYTLRDGLEKTLDYEFLKKNKDEITFYTE